MQATSLSLGSRNSLSLDLSRDNKAPHFVQQHQWMPRDERAYEYDALLASGEGRESRRCESFIYFWRSK
ncbi:hypothetical protein K443DRAFT_685511 [Laccaria amethystina LaAM-08-1]|uniref:Unplaced genomic scaffold K443scaffold_412, whole genome shotgun sequence n=1 Tax=Laccaria amethystina LaAM-08-1 TaxID=1095629 RepID=A0A0C9X6I6_9AGAR|nr:hypothetical protein K443DRAFT_685511 [Laccaria amethystina LaAM-08-1]